MTDVNLKNEINNVFESIFFSLGDKDSFWSGSDHIEMVIQMIFDSVHHSPKFEKYMKQIEIVDEVTNNLTPGNKQDDWEKLLKIHSFLISFKNEVMEFSEESLELLRKYIEVVRREEGILKDYGKYSILISDKYDFDIGGIGDERFFDHFYNLKENIINKLFNFPKENK